jgi:hypothetical protein
MSLASPKTKLFCDSADSNPQNIEHSLKNHSLLAKAQISLGYRQKNPFSKNVAIFGLVNSRKC